MGFDVLFQVIYMLIITLFIAAAWWGTLRLMDKAADIEFKYTIQNLSTAGAIYFGCRAIAVALLYQHLLRLIF